MNTKILTTCKNSIDAQLIKNQLENEGIKSELLNEHFSSLLPSMYNILGSGVQIMVLDEDFEKARQIINQDDEVKCPNCGSTNLMDEMAQNHNKFVSFFIALIFAEPIGNLLGNYKCRDCKTEFSK